MKRKTGIPALALVIISTIGCLTALPEKLLPPVLANSGKALLAGVRSSPYGIKPFPAPSEWKSAISSMTGYFAGSMPGAIWIVGEFRGSKDCRLGFPGEGTSYTNIEFAAEDIHEKHLSYFDSAGIKVYLQVEPAQADMKTLIDLVLGRYKTHECVAGFGVDVEWHREFENPKWGAKVDDETARQWEDWVKSHNPRYRLFLKHWDRRWMPETYRGDIIFVDDSQKFKDFEAMVIEFVNDWANYFYPNTVVFQVGYRSDRTWWQKLAIPPRTIGEAIGKRIKQDWGIIWVDFTLRDVLLPGGER